MIVRSSMIKVKTFEVKWHGSLYRAPSPGHICDMATNLLTERYTNIIRNADQLELEWPHGWYIFGWYLILVTVL